MFCTVGEPRWPCETHDYRSSPGIPDHPDFPESCSRLSGEPHSVISSVIFFNTLFMNIINNVNVFQFYEGYGQTECTAGCTMSMPGDWSAGKI